MTIPDQSINNDVTLAKDCHRGLSVTKIDHAQEKMAIQSIMRSRTGKSGQTWP